MIIDEISSHNKVATIHKMTPFVRHIHTFILLCIMLCTSFCLLSYTLYFFMPKLYTTYPQPHPQRLYL